MSYAVGQFTSKTATDIRADCLRTVRNAMIQAGIPNPQLGPGSDEDFWATAISNELAPVYANTVIKADAQMPDTATGDVAAGQTVGADLFRIMKIYGLAPRPAGPSAGFITLDCSTSTLIPDGSQLVDVAGLRFQVAVGGTYSATNPVALIAVDTGPNTNHAAGDTLTWVSAPPFCNSKQLVSTGGLTGAIAAENNDTARGRLLGRLANPPGAGNWAQVASYAEASSPIVQKAFVYPAVNGPSTCHVAVVGYAAPPPAAVPAVNRDVAATVMAGTVAPYVLGQMPEFTETVVTTVTNVSVDVSVGLTLPSSPAASPAGPGGGWVDGTPWPAISGYVIAGGGNVPYTYANVTAVTPGGGGFTVNAPTSPTAGVTHICMVDTTTWKVVRGKVLTVSGSAGAYAITVDNPFPNVAVGSLIFPDAVNMDTYVATWLAGMALLGPGEKTTNASVLSRGFRHPPPQLSWPYALNAQLLKRVENSGAEVLATQYYYRSQITPAVPGSVANPPNQFVPRQVAFYPI